MNEYTKKSIDMLHPGGSDWREEASERDTGVTAQAIYGAPAPLLPRSPKPQAKDLPTHILEVIEDEDGSHSVYKSGHKALLNKPKTTMTIHTNRGDVVLEIYDKIQGDHYKDLPTLIADIQNGDLGSKIHGVDTSQR